MTMTANFVSSQYLANALVAPVAQAQSALATATTELASGEYADLGVHLGSQSGYELSLKSQVAQIKALTDGNGVVATNLSTAAAALTSMATAASNAQTSLVSWMSGSVNGAGLASVGDTALKSLIASANTSTSGVYVFGGINSSSAPVNDYYATASTAKSAIDSAFKAQFGMLPTDPGASSISASDITSFLSGAFAATFSGTGWTTNWSSASSTNATATIAPGQTATVSVSANDKSFQQLTQAYTMLSEFGNSALSDAAKQAVATAASTMISTGQTSLTALQTSVGVQQAAITSANTAMASQSTLIQTQVDNLDQVDVQALNAKVSSLQTQLQMAYQLTSKLQNLSLANYL